jgi:CRP/FNR family transcriptional regulator, anaerobic regulatory protein
MAMTTRALTPQPGRLRNSLSADDLAALDAIADRVSHGPGHYLYFEGDDASSAYGVESGLMMLERVASDGARQVIAFVFPGDYIGIPLDGRHMVSAKCLKPTKLWRYGFDRLNSLLERNPRVEAAIHSVTNRILAYTLDQVCVLGRMTARERVLYFLLHLAEREGKASTSPLLVDVPMTRLDMADYLGLTVETVSRTLSQLKTEGIIRLREGHVIELPDVRHAEATAERFRRVD